VHCLSVSFISGSSSFSLVGKAFAALPEDFLGVSFDTEPVTFPEFRFQCLHLFGGEFEHAVASGAKQMVVGFKVSLVVTPVLSEIKFLQEIRRDQKVEGTVNRGAGNLSPAGFNPVQQFLCGEVVVENHDGVEDRFSLTGQFTAPAAQKVAEAFQFFAYFPHPLRRKIF
jgi:hypothetical protein